MNYSIERCVPRQIPCHGWKVAELALAAKSDLTNGSLESKKHKIKRGMMRVYRGPARGSDGKGADPPNVSVRLVRRFLQLRFFTAIFLTSDVKLEINRSSDHMIA